MKSADDKLQLTALLKLEEFHEFLVDGIGVSAYRLFAREDSDGPWVLAQEFPAAQTGKSIIPPSALFQFFDAGTVECLDAAGEAPADPAAKAAREVLRAANAALALAFVANGRCVGLLLLNSANDPQARCVRLLVRHFNRMLQRLDEARSQELLGWLPGGLAHDLRNWLTPVTTCLQLGVQAEDRPKAEALRPAAVRSVEVIRKSLDQACYFSQHLQPRIRPAHLPTLVRQAIEMATPALEEKNLTALVDVPAELSLPVDEVLLLRLLGNLLSNAIHASPANKPIRLELKTVADPVSGQNAVRLLMVNVRSAEQFLAEEGEPPEQAQRRKFGLPICREIVRLHGGRMQLTCTEDPPLISAEVTLPMPPKAGVEAAKRFVVSAERSSHSCPTDSRGLGL